MGRPPDESAEHQAIGRSKGGLTTKLILFLDRPLLWSVREVRGQFFPYIWARLVVRL